MAQDKPDILRLLAGKDRRSIGQADKVVELVYMDPTLFDVLIEGLARDDSVIRMRSADALEKVTRTHPEYLIPYKDRMINEIQCIQQQEVRWHVALMLPRLILDHSECMKVVDILTVYMQDKSSIVKTNSMQALADIAGKDRELRPAIYMMIQKFTATGTHAMKSRGQKLIKRLEKLI